MSIAKGKVIISKEKLSELFRLPEGVEILFVNDLDLENGLEFIVASAEETSITKKDIPVGQMRRITVNQLIKEYEEERITNLVSNVSAMTGGFTTGRFGDMSDLVLVLPKQTDIPHWTNGSASAFVSANDKSTMTNASINTITINNVNKPKEEHIKDLFENIIKGIKEKGKM